MMYLSPGVVIDVYLVTSLAVLVLGVSQLGPDFPLPFLPWLTPVLIHVAATPTPPFVQSHVWK